MEIATAPTVQFERVTACFAKKFGMFEKLGGLIEEADSLKSIEARWRAMEDYDRKGWLPSGWLDELREVYRDHKQILQEQE